MRVAIFALFLLAALGYAAWRGGGPERVMAGIAATMVGSDLLLHQFVAPEYAVLDFGHLLIDGFGASATLLLALFAYRFWPMIAAVLHILPIEAAGTGQVDIFHPAAALAERRGIGLAGVR